MREAVLEILESELTEGILEKKPEAIRRFVRALYEEFAHAEEVNERLIRIEEEIKRLGEEVKHLTETMKFGFEQMEKRFEDVNKRFEDMNKRFEDMNKRFEEQSKTLRTLGWLIGIFLGLPTWASFLLALLKVISG